VTNAVVSQEVTLTCPASPNTSVIWDYQRYCEHFEHGMHVCSDSPEIVSTNPYVIGINKAGEPRLLICGVTTGMTGLYHCKDRISGCAIYSVLLNVISKYTSVSFCYCESKKEKMQSFSIA